MKKIFIIIISFFIIYYPPILTFNVAFVVGGISIFGLMIHYIKVKKIHFSNHIYNLLMILVVIFVYLTIISIVNGTNILEANKNTLFWTVTVIPTGLYVSILIQNYNIQEKEYFIIEIMLMCAMIQAILVIIAYLNPSFQNWTITKMIAYGFSESRFTALSSFRWYGFAGKLGYTTPILQMFLAMVSLYLCIEKEKKYIIYFPFLFLSAIINARTSIVIFVIGVVILLVDLLRRGKIKYLGRLVFISFFIILVIGFVSIYMIKGESYNSMWINEGLESLINILTLNDLTSIYYFNPQKYILPFGFHFILGKGQYTGSSLGYSTDIGFVNDIYLGGILFLLIILYFFYRVLIPFLKSETGTYRYIFFYGIISLLISNIKGYVFSFNEFTTFFILLSIIYYSTVSSLKKGSVKK